MAKRGPTTELNHENWEREEKAEEKGIFAQAPPEELQNRVIKKARRKLTTDESQTEDSGSKSVFSGFKGFGSVASASTVSSSTAFSFLSKLSSTTSTDSSPKLTTEKNDGEKSKDYKFNQSSTYYNKLKSLNQAISNWIKQHVDQNPLCILSPIFQDYEKYLKEIQVNSKNGNHEAPMENKSETLQSTTGFKFLTDAVTTTVTTNSIPSSNLFTFSTTKSDKKFPGLSSTSPTGATADGIATTSGGSILSTSTPPVSSFSFGQATNPLKPGGFGFASSPPFSFGIKNQLNQQTNQNTDGNKEENANDDDDEPPKVEFKPIEEEDSVYSKRCKVFVKSESNYKDLGIGTLHLKPVKDIDKTQLIVRADTNIGKILLNFILNDSIPTQRMGKNNVMMVCIPTPETKPQTPIAVLLRVKTGEEADDLLETIEKYKK